MTAKPELLEEFIIQDAVIYDLDDEDDEDDHSEIYYYYDDEENFVKLKQRDMSDTQHEALKQYLMAVVNWSQRKQRSVAYGELNFYETTRYKEEPLYPDVAVLKGQEWRRLPSYRLKVDGPAPDVVIEIISTKTRYRDLNKKPTRYEKWGTLEYFVYDPRERKRKLKKPRLWGWRMNADKVYEELVSAQPDGRLWSEQLQCWLVPDNDYVRLYRASGERLLTETEALRQRNNLLTERLRELGEDPDNL